MEELLAASRDGCTEAIMLAHGFSIQQMVELIGAGLASATAERVVAGNAPLRSRSGALCATSIMSEPDWRPSDRVMEERWRRALETAGVHVVRARLVQSPGGSAAIIRGIGTQHITKGYVERWLRDQEAAIEQEAARRHRQVLMWAVVAAVAGIIAALTGIIAVWPILRG
jgi:hypothetical protein